MKVIIIVITFIVFTIIFWNKLAYFVSSINLLIVVLGGIIMLGIITFNSLTSGVSWVQKEKIKIDEGDSTHPSKEKNESKKLKIDTSNNKYLKQALKDSPYIKDILESTEQEIEQEKKMIEGLKNDYKVWKYQEVIDFNEMYMWPIHTKNIVEFLWVVAVSILQVGNKKSFEWYVWWMVAVMNLKEGSNAIDDKLNAIVGVLKQYNIDYNFSKKSFVKKLSVEQQDKALRWVTQCFLLA